LQKVEAVNHSIFQMEMKYMFLEVMALLKEDGFSNAEQMVGLATNFKMKHCMVKENHGGNQSI